MAHIQNSINLKKMYKHFVITHLDLEVILYMYSLTQWLYLCLIKDVSFQYTSIRLTNTFCL